MTSEVKSEYVKLEYMKSLWIGAIARVDLIAGDNLVVIINTSKHVNVHKTDFYKSNEVYLKQYGKLLVPVYDTDITVYLI
jgi:hypothetical protein